MKMLFCSDGSAAAENAVRFGALIAAGCHAETTILGICEQAGTEDALVQALRRSQELLKQHNLNAELITKDGRPVTEIVKRTRETPYDLVVIGAERRPGRTPALRSAKAYQIIEAVAPPVLVVVGERPVLRRVLLCSAGGAQAESSGINRRDRQWREGGGYSLSRPGRPAGDVRWFVAAGRRRGTAVTF